VQPGNSERVYVATQGGGLHRSINGGKTWQRLDQRPADKLTCPQGTVLTKTLSVGALLVTEEQVLVGTGSPHDWSHDRVPCGLYASIDGGDCWDLVDAGRTQVQYLALDHVPGAPGHPLLILAVDWWKEPGDDCWGLWRLDLDAPTDKEKIWTHPHRVAVILAHDGDPPGWYAATDLGEVVHGTLDVPAQVERLPRVTRCLPACAVDLASDANAGPPLLLAKGRLYRLTQGPWWRRVWP